MQSPLPIWQQQGEGHISKNRKGAGAVSALGLLASAALGALVIAAATQATPQLAPVNIDPPSITGTARVGDVVTARNGSWEKSPSSFRYRWLRCNASGVNCVLTSSDGQTYRLSDVDAGRTLRVRVTAANADGSSTARSEPSDVVQPKRLRSRTRAAPRSRARRGSARS